MPSAIIRSSTAASLDAGPIVATILVERMPEVYTESRLRPHSPLGVTAAGAP
jgi:hypothetical protein